MAALAERFEALVDRNGAHHLWLGATDQAGIPQMRVDGRLTTARRVAWELHHGALPHGTRVRGCRDDPRCVRLDHLGVTPRRDSVTRQQMRRPRGQGSLRQIRLGVWGVAVTADTRERVFHTVTGSRTDAERELARLASQHGQPPTTLDALVSIYHAHMTEVGRSPSTVRRYQQLWRTWLAPSLGASHPNDVRTREIERALTAMHHAGQSPRSIHQAAVVLNTTFSWARERDLARSNPVIGCELPNGIVINSSRHR